MATSTKRQADFPEEQEFELALRSLSGAVGFETERLLILNEARVTLPNLRTRLKLYKVLNTKTGDSWRVALDKENNPVDYDEILSKERALGYEKYGRMQAGLYRLVELGEARTIPVLIKYAVPEEQIDKGTMDLDQALETAARCDEIMDKVQQETAALFRETLRQFDLPEPDEVTPSGPFVSAELPPDVIRELSTHPRVAFIGLDQRIVVLDYPTIPESLPTTRADWVHGTGTKGAGIKIAVLESGGLAISASNFHIGATQVASGADWHMTKSVGIIGNQYNESWEGYAPEATVYIANNSDYKQAYDWAKSQGVEVITMSWHDIDEETDGDLHSRDIYFDYVVVHYPWPTVFTSAGNQAASDAFSSGKGYNFFGVANVVNDGDGNRCNDTIQTGAYGSSYKNPTSPHSDREVPEVAAPGSRHELLGTSFGGTSCATPVTASIAALLMSTNTSLKIWPEAIRAILLATANYQNADGANWSSHLDGKDGTGMINAQYAYWTANRRETGTEAQYRAHDYGTMRASDFEAGFFEKTWKARTFTTNSRIRVAFTWNSKTAAADGAPSSSVLDADLDLWVYDPDGHLVAWSATWDSNYEFVELTPSKTGEYTIKIRGYSVPDGFWSWYGVAWTTHYELCP